jgi:hypothetical protein
MAIQTTEANRYIGNLTGFSFLIPRINDKPITVDIPPKPMKAIDENSLIRGFFEKSKTILSAINAMKTKREIDNGFDCKPL